MSSEATPPRHYYHKSQSTHSRSRRKSRGSRTTSFGHSKPCQKTIYIYASLNLIISLIKLMNVNYAYNNKKSDVDFYERYGVLHPSNNLATILVSDVLN